MALAISRLNLNADFILQGFKECFHLLHAIALKTIGITQDGGDLSGFISFNVGKIRFLGLNKLSGLVKDLFLGACHEFPDWINDPFLHVKQGILLSGELGQIPGIGFAGQRFEFFQAPVPMHSETDTGSPAPPTG